jgi:uncharacterized membrane protein YuzA (DUF378 family)
MKLPSIDTVVMALLIIGGLNAGLASTFDLNVIHDVIGSGTAADVLYALIGLSAVYTVAGMLGITSNE